MLKYIVTKDVRYGGQLFRGRKIIGEEKMLALIYPLIGKAIFTWGWRSKKEQEGMVAKGTSKTMDSNHRRGVAFDVWNWKECESALNKLGFINNLKPWDPGHFPFGGEDLARKSFKIIDTLPNNLEEYRPTPKKETPAPKVDEVVQIPVTVIPTPEIVAPAIEEVVIEQPNIEEVIIEKPIIEQEKIPADPKGEVTPIDWKFIVEKIKELINLIFNK